MQTRRRFDVDTTLFRDFNNVVTTSKQRRMFTRIAVQLQRILFLVHILIGNSANWDIILFSYQFVSSYLQSLQELYLSGGRFVKKITYRSPSQYSIEAVEVSRGFRNRIEHFLD